MTAARRYTPTTRRKPPPVGDEQAACTGRTDLPWVPEPAANLRQQWEMRAVCDTCPILRACARHAVETGPAGFYAGTWIPSVGRGRSVALQQLRQKAGVR